MGCCESCYRESPKPRPHYFPVADDEFSHVDEKIIRDHQIQPSAVLVTSKEPKEFKKVETQKEIVHSVAEKSYGSISLQSELEKEVTSPIISVKEINPQPVITIAPPAEIPAKLSPKRVLTTIVEVTTPPVTPKISFPIDQVFDRTSTHAREFRIFLPHVDGGDLPWLSQALAVPYREALQVLTLLTLSGNNAPEKREDTYMIGQPYFGLKYRGQNKLEMKVRTDNKPLFLEKWSKVKFGKKKLTHYKDDILTYLSDVGYSSHATENDALIEQSQYITVAKSRNCISAEKVIVEVCELSVPEKQAKFDAQIKRKKWVSVAIEGHGNEIEEFMLHQHKHSELFKVLTLAKNIYTAHPKEAVRYGFLPVVSGYPMWVRLLASKVPEEEVEKEVFASVNALLNFVK